MSYRTAETILGVIMGTWDDEVRGRMDAIAGALLGIGQVCDFLIETAHPDDDLTILVDTRQWCRDRANLFSPPGEPQGGYPQEEGGAQVINLDAWREWKKLSSG